MKKSGNEDDKRRAKQMNKSWLKLFKVDLCTEINSHTVMIFKHFCTYCHKITFVVRIVIRVPKRPTYWIIIKNANEIHWNTFARHRCQLASPPPIRCVWREPRWLSVRSESVCSDSMEHVESVAHERLFCFTDYVKLSPNYNCMCEIRSMHRCHVPQFNSSEKSLRCTVVHSDI